MKEFWRNLDCLPKNYSYSGFLLAELVTREGENSKPASRSQSVLQPDQVSVVAISETAVGGHIYHKGNL